jgi:hypothetical protein
MATEALMRVLICAALLTLAACGQGAPTASTAQTTTPPAPPPDLHGALIGIGDNPVWRLDADPTGAVTLTIGDHETYTGHYAEPHRNPEGGFTMEAGDVTLDLTVEPCTIGGARYPLRAIAQPHRQAAVEGCAYVRWDQKLVELMPQIDACIAASPATRRVNFAGPYQGAVLVRLAGGDAQVDCRVNNGAASVSPRDPALHVLGDGDAIFVRAPGEQPGGECFTAPEVKAADGTLLGWMDDPQGC